jgi:hypothetical protein
MPEALERVKIAAIPQNLLDQHDALASLAFPSLF